MLNRYTLVSRHNPVITDFGPRSPLSVGNGEFVFTVDPTGLQSFPEAYAEELPLTTMANWGWHTTPAPGGRRIEHQDYRLTAYATYGRMVGYATGKEGQAEEYEWLRKNPHRFHLGRIGLALNRPDGTAATQSDLAALGQTLDLWRGMLVSRFTACGVPAEVRTCVHPDRDLIAVAIDSPLAAEGRLAVNFTFPYGSPEKTGADWEAEERHRTVLISAGRQRVTLLRVLDATTYFVTIFFTGAEVKRQGKHHFLLVPPSGAGRIEFCAEFTPHRPRTPLPAFIETAAAAATSWKGFWSSGGMVELAGSRDPRALELERRVVLSQYLTAIQCGGALPPAETGLTCNSWYGKFHLEMHWWHGVHFAYWNRLDFLERSLWWYQLILPQAEKLAQSQGYSGARWPKMVGPEGLDSPSPIGPLLIWQQPHPIYYAELCYRAAPSRKTLERYREIVFQTAEFLASYAVYEQAGDRYVLGPPVIPAQECHRPEVTLNPTFELAYWAFGLETALQWRRRLGLPPEAKWEQVRAKLSPLPVAGGVYLAHERCPATFTAFNTDHPSLLGVFGMLPGWGVDRVVMAETLRRVLATWRLETAWGWDFPLIAMTAARLDQPELAVEVLLSDSPKNIYLPNGHNRQGARADLPLYLPGNGGLLTAVAMMAAGWAGGPQRHAPGFPADGSWAVAWEGLRPML